jgi:hypothetical protein
VTPETDGEGTVGAGSGGGLGTETVGTVGVDTLGVETVGVGTVTVGTVTVGTATVGTVTEGTDGVLGTVTARVLCGRMTATDQNTSARIRAQDAARAGRPGRHISRLTKPLEPPVMACQTYPILAIANRALDDPVRRWISTVEGNPSIDVPPELRCCPAAVRRRGGASELSHHE